MRVPLSAGARRLWFLDALADGAPLHNNPAVFRLTGPVSVDALQRAADLVVARHPALRTTIAEVDGEPVGRVVELSAADVTVQTVRDADEFAARAVREPFDLGAGPLFKVRLGRITSTDHVLVINTHHAVVDGTSLSVLCREISALYADPGCSLPDPGSAPEVAAQDPADRVSELDGVPDLLTLPTDRPRPRMRAFRGELRRHAVPDGLTARVDALARAARATRFVVLLAAYAATLGTTAGQDDVVVATLVSGRPGPEFAGVVGMFVNPVPLRVDVGGDPTFRELLARARRAVSAGLGGAAVPFDRLVEAVGAARDPSHAPLCQAHLVMQEPPDLALPGVRAERMPPGTGTADVDLTVMVESGGSELAVVTEHDTALFDGATIDGLTGRLLSLLDRACADPDRRLSALTAVASVADPGSAPAPATALDLVRFSSGGLAVDSMSYAELDRRSAALASVLRSMGVGPEVWVAVDLPRGPDLVVALLGIWRAGAVYVPVDPRWPEARRRAVTDAAFIALTELPALPSDFDRVDPGTVPDSLAYVFHTSGSTGRPKAVGVPHRAVAAMLARSTAMVGLGPGDVVAAMTSPAFDISVWELLAPLTVGARLATVPAETVVDGPALARRLRAEGVTTVQVTPSVWAVLVAAGGVPEGVRVRVSIGEVLTPDLAAALGGAHLWNTYGPTETTIWSTAVRVREGSPYGIGAPLDGVALYLLNAGLRPVADDVVGEVYIGGFPLARGYIGAPAQTSTRFVADPFSPIPGARMYATGDLARRRPTGLLDFVGRRDTQLKIRGHRVEPAEIEAALQTHPEITDARVIGDNDRLVAYVTSPSHPTWPTIRDHLTHTLPAYLVPSAMVVLDHFPLTPSGKLDTRALPPPTQTPLPATPHPGLETTLAEIFTDLLNHPTTRDTDFFLSGGHSLAAAKAIAQIKTRTGANISIRTLFANPTVAALAAAITRPHSPITAPTTTIDPPDHTPTTPDPTPPTHLPGSPNHLPNSRNHLPGSPNHLSSSPSHFPDSPSHFPSSPSHFPGSPNHLSIPQYGIWLANQSGQDNGAYTIHAAFRLDGPLNEPDLRTRFAHTLATHPALRTAITLHNNTPHLTTTPHTPALTATAWRTTDLTTHPTPWPQAHTQATQDADHPFDLTNPPLVRAHLIKTAPTTHLLTITAHHIICDDTSMSLLLKTLTAPTHPTPSPPTPPNPTTPPPTHPRHQTTTFWTQTLRDAPTNSGPPPDHPSTTPPPPDSSTPLVHLPTMPPHHPDSTAPNPPVGISSNHLHTTPPTHPAPASPDHPASTSPHQHHSTPLNNSPSTSPDQLHSTPPAHPAPAPPDHPSSTSPHQHHSAPPNHTSSASPDQLLSAPPTHPVPIPSDHPSSTSPHQHHSTPLNNSPSTSPHQHHSTPLDHAPSTSPDQLLSAPPTRPAPPNHPTSTSPHHPASTPPAHHPNTALTHPSNNPTQPQPGATHRFTIPADLAHRFLTWCRTERGTAFAGVLAVFAIVSSSRGGGDDLVVGAPIDTRPPGQDDTVGMFVTTLPLRIRTSPQTTPRDLLAQATQAVADAMDHADISLAEIIATTGHNHPLFQTMLVLNPEPTPITFPGLTTTPLPIHRSTSRFDLTLHIRQTATTWPALIDYRTDRYEADTIARIADQVLAVMAAVTQHPDRPLPHLNLLSPQDNAAHTALQPPHTVLDLIADATARTPDATAVLDLAAPPLTYRDLDHRSSAVARHLHDHGIRQEDPVAVAIPSSADAIVAILGVLKAGGCFVPIDPTQPPARQQALITASGATTVLTRDTLPTTGHHEPTPIHPTQLAYIVHTSGSTGEPKGVEVQHDTLLNLTTAFIAEHDLTAADRLLMLPPPHFDAAYGDIFPVLATGATLVIHPDPGSITGADLRRLCADHQLSAVDAAAPLWQRWVSDLAGEHLPLKMMAVGGDIVPTATVRAWAEHGIPLYNHYGPTEATVCATSHRTIDGSEHPTRLPIGRPLPNVRIHLLDRSLRRVPVGVVGEIYIGGLAPARGYRGNPTATATSFVADPHRPGARMYRTGDLAKLNPHGTLEFIGRADDQLKIRGHRVEPGEIAAVLTTHPDVTEAVVLARGDRLIAYVGAPPSTTHLRDFCADRLPAHLVPDTVVVLDALPTGTTGKINAAALPTLTPHTPTNPPRTPTEQTIATIWSDTLNHPDVDRDANFFAIGGHSLMAAHVLAAVRTRLGITVPMRTLFAAPTVAAFAAAIQRPTDLPTPDQLRADAVPPPDVRLHPASPPDTRTHTISRPDNETPTISPPDTQPHAAYPPNTQPHAAHLPNTQTHTNSPPNTQTHTISPTHTGHPTNTEPPAIPAPDLHPNPPRNMPLHTDSSPNTQSHSISPPSTHPHTNSPSNPRPHTIHPPHTSPTPTSPRRILLTGATGFLGRHLLTQLLTRTDAHIHCLVRPTSLHRLPTTPRVTPIPGDLTTPNLGLSTEDHHTLTTMDAIYHNAAVPHFAAPYHDLKPAHVAATATILRLAATAAAPLHLISTLGVFLGDAYHNRVITEADTPTDPTGLTSGYDLSKWVADAMATAARARGLAVSIHRIAAIVGDTSTGAAETGSAFSRWLAGCLAAGVVPDTGEVLDMVPVDTVAAAIVALGGAVGDYHYHGDGGLTRADLAAALTAAGHPTEVVPYQHWRERMLADPAGPFAPLAFSLPERPRPRPRFDCSRTWAAAAEAGVVFPPADERMLRRHLDHLTGAGSG